MFNKNLKYAFYEKWKIWQITNGYNQIYQNEKYKGFQKVKLMICKKPEGLPSFFNHGNVIVYKCLVGL